MLPRKVFEKLHPVMAILVLFEQVFGQILFKFLAPNSESFTKYDAFYLRVLIYASLWRKEFCDRRGSRLQKNCVHQKLVENGRRSPHTLPGSAPGSSQVTNSHKNRPTFFVIAIVREG